MHRRRAIADALSSIVELEFWNAGGSGSVESTVADAAVTEVAAGSGLLVPGLFDHYQSFEPRPAAFFGLRVSRKPAPGIATVHGRVEFLQLVGITQAELDWAAAKAGPTAEERQAVGRQLAERLIDSGNTHLITDVSRTESVV